jgi:hypothetical protein
MGWTPWREDVIDGDLLWILPFPQDINGGNKEAHLRVQVCFLNYSCW